MNKIKWFSAAQVIAAAVALVIALPRPALAQDDDPQMIPAPDRKPGEGEGPFERLIIRGATLIDGTGAPPIGPVDIVIEGNRITKIKSVGYPGLAIDEDRGAFRAGGSGPNGSAGADCPRGHVVILDRRRGRQKRPD